MAANYDRTAWFYDRLSYLVFGKAQLNAQNHFLHLIANGSRILIAGGGTGQILEALTELYPQGLYIDYVEISANMTALARKRNTGANVVNFITHDINSFCTPMPYDAIITAFLFDNFTDTSLQQVFAHLNKQLKPGGLWLDTDFQLTGALWQTLMLQTMYTFFKIFGAVNVAKLPDITRLYQQYGYINTEQKSFYGRFINAKACYKPLV